MILGPRQTLSPMIPGPAVLFDALKLCLFDCVHRHPRTDKAVE